MSSFTDKWAGAPIAEHKPPTSGELKKIENLFQRRRPSDGLPEKAALHETLAGSIHTGLKRIRVKFKKEDEEVEAIARVINAKFEHGSTVNGLRRAIDVMETDVGLEMLKEFFTKREPIQRAKPVSNATASPSVVEQLLPRNETSPRSAMNEVWTMTTADFTGLTRQEKRAIKHGRSFSMDATVHDGVEDISLRLVCPYCGGVGGAHNAVPAGPVVLNAAAIVALILRSSGVWPGNPPPAAQHDEPRDIVIPLSNESLSDDSAIIDNEAPADIAAQSNSTVPLYFGKVADADADASCLTQTLSKVEVRSHATNQPSIENSSGLNELLNVPQPTIGTFSTANGVSDMEVNKVDARGAILNLCWQNHAVLFLIFCAIVLFYFMFASS